MLFMRATGEEVGASRSKNDIGKEGEKDKTRIGNAGPEATTYSALTVESLHGQAGLAFRGNNQYSLYGSCVRC